jgi:hypothetical protein
MRRLRNSRCLESLAAGRAACATPRDQPDKDRGRKGCPNRLRHTHSFSDLGRRRRQRSAKIVAPDVVVAGFESVAEAVTPHCVVGGVDDAIGVVVAGQRLLDECVVVVTYPLGGDISRVIGQPRGAVYEKERLRREVALRAQHQCRQVDPVRRCRLRVAIAVCDLH